MNPYVLDSTLFGRALMGEDGGEVPGETPTEPDDTEFPRNSDRPDREDRGGVTGAEDVGRGARVRVPGI